MEAGTPEWLGQVSEPVLDPDRRIVDPHHHLWPPGGIIGYDTDDLHGDTSSGHNVVATVFVECRAGYHEGGSDQLRPVGETEFVAAAAQRLADDHGAGPPIAAVVGHADLRADGLDEVLDAHEAAGGGLFRGIRDAGARALDRDVMMIPGWAPEGLYADADFRAGVGRLGERGLSYDTWHYHWQNVDFADLARAVPGTTMVLDHFGTPVGVGRFEGQRDDIFASWKVDMADIARCENVVAKLGGLAMPDNGYGWHLRDRPPTSDQFVAEQERWYHHAIECFGPDRCMFESNFPVDKMSLSYPVLWNGLKKIASRYTDQEQEALFSGTASRVYRL